MVSWGNDNQPTGVVNAVNGIYPNPPTNHRQQLCNRGHELTGIILKLAEIWMFIVSKENNFENNGTPN